MHAIRIEAHGGPEALRHVSVPEPTPDPHRPITVQVSHVGLNHLDLWVRRGVPGHTYPLPLIPGSDVVGTRQDTGETVVLHPSRGCMRCDRCLSGRHDLCRQFRIRGESMDGGMCERVQVSEAELLPCPLPPERAAALPLSLLTAWHMLIGRARVQPGDRVLIQAGASGVGSLAIQVARMVGARVAATASTPEKRSRCLSLGAELAIPYDQVRSELKAWTHGAGVDIAVDHVGTDTWEPSLRALRWGGTYVSCGATTGHLAPLNLRVLFFKQLSVLGSTMGSMGEMTRAWRAVLDGQIRPVVDRVLPMSELGRAHMLLEDRAISGKIVVSQDLS